jgi:hypothetical protein
MKLTSELLLYELLTQCLPGFDHERKALGPPLLDTGVPVAKEPKTSIRASAGNAVEKNEGYFPRLLWTKISDFIVV